MREVLLFFLGNTVILKAFGIKCPTDTYLSFPLAFPLE